MTNIAMEAPIEIDGLPIKNGGSFHGKLHWDCQGTTAILASKMGLQAALGKRYVTRAPRHCSEDMSWYVIYHGNMDYRYLISLEYGYGMMNLNMVFIRSTEKKNRNGS